MRNDPLKKMSREKILGLKYSIAAIEYKKQILNDRRKNDDDDETKEDEEGA